MLRLVLILSLFAGLAQSATYYISPSGNDSNNCTAAQSSSTPKLTFASLFACGTAGSTYILLDGTYTAATTGVINWDTTTYTSRSAEAPSGSSDSVRTIVKAQNEGSVKITGQLYVGRSSTTYQYITFQGITWEDAATTAAFIRNSSYITVQRCGFHSPSVDDQGSVLGIGNNEDLPWPSTHHILIEDVWVWGKARAVTIDYWNRYNVWRRVLIRGDGCTNCTAQPNVRHTVYSSGNTSVQNVLVLDTVLDGASEYGDFCQANHDDPARQDANEWLGTISLNSEGSAYTMDPDSTGSSTLRNFVVWNPGLQGFNAGGGSGGYAGTFDAQYGTIYQNGTGTAFRIQGPTGTVRNVALGGTGSRGYNSGIDPSYVDVWGTWSEGAYYAGTCSAGCLTSNFLSDTGPSVKYPVRIEAGSTLSAAGYNGTYGTRLGADVTKRYGVDGAIYGATDYNTLSGTNLWPWPNEARIKKEMCTDSGITRGFCADTSLTHYIMNQLGNGNPFSASTDTRVSLAGATALSGSVSIH